MNAELSAGTDVDPSPASHHGNRLARCAGWFSARAVELFEFIDRRRVLLALGVLALSCMLEINGSSIGIWNDWIPNEQAVPALLGVPRAIRSDEYAVFTPMTMAQSFAQPAWPYFNDIPRAMPTDMFSVYAQPVRHPLVLFRPFLAGFLFLGFAKGLAFFWMSRWIALLLASYELFKLLTDGNKGLSAVCAAFVVLSPAVQWWGAINALADMLVFGCLFVVCLDGFMVKTTLRERLPRIAVMAWTGVCYALTLYPAAQVPLAYVFGALSVWVVCRRFAACRMTLRTWAALAVAAGVAGACLIWYLDLSGAAFKVMSETVYPGKRVNCGGGLLDSLGRSWGSIFFPWSSSGLEPSNVFELASFFDFFPLGIALSVFLLVVRRRRDLLLAALLVACVLLGAYCLFGFPEGVAKATLLSMSHPPRCFVALGFAQFLLLIRALSLLDRRMSPLSLLGCSAVFAVMSAGLARVAYPQYLSEQRLVFIGIAAAASCFSFFSFRRHPLVFSIPLVMLSLLAGAFVNPVQRGDAGVTRSALFREIRSIVAVDRSAWIVEGESAPLNQISLMAGAPTVNAGTLCPPLERWREFDPDGKFAHVWNRYSTGFKMVLEPDAEFRPGLFAPDQIQLSLAPKMLKDLGVRYVLSRRDVSTVHDDSVRLKPLKRIGDWTIFVVSE